METKFLYLSDGWYDGVRLCIGSDVKKTYIKLPVRLKPLVGKDGWVVSRGRYGFVVTDRSLFLLCGPDSKTKTLVFPWTEHTLGPYELRRPDGSIHYTSVDPGSNSEELLEAIRSCPKETFLVTDPDGHELKAVAYISSRTSTLGKGKFSWLRYLSKLNEQRVLEFDLVDENGKHKCEWSSLVTSLHNHSWTHTVETSVYMLDGETSEQAMQRFCRTPIAGAGRDRSFKYIGVAPDTKGAV